MKKALKFVLIALFWILVWYFVSLIINLPLLFPQPWTVIKRLGELLCSSHFFMATLSSFGRILAGILIAILLGSALALICSLSKTTYEFLTPLVSIIKSTPIVAFVFLVNLFLYNEKTVIFISFLMVFPIVFSNIYQGIKSTDKDLIEMCNLYKVKFKKRLTSLYIPSVIPYFLSSLLSSIGLAWKAGIAAEVLCSPVISIGIEIYHANESLEFVDLFAWTAWVIILSMIFELITTKLIKYVLKKKQLVKEIKL